MIHWSTVVYIIVMILLVIWWLKDFLDGNSGGGLWSHGRRKESGIEGIIAIILIIVFTLIWGGIFWW